LRWKADWCTRAPGRDPCACACTGAQHARARTCAHSVGRAGRDGQEEAGGEAASTLRRRVYSVEKSRPFSGEAASIQWRSRVHSVEKPRPFSGEAPEKPRPYISGEAASIYLRRSRRRSRVHPRRSRIHTSPEKPRTSPEKPRPSPEKPHPCISGEAAHIPGAAASIHLRRSRVRPPEKPPGSRIACARAAPVSRRRSRRGLTDSKEPWKRSHFCWIWQCARALARRW
jgi:hypothetical protein